MQRSERYDAKLKGLKTFDTGKPCINGHLSFRYTSSGNCAKCVTSTANDTGHFRHVLGPISLRVAPEDVERLALIIFAYAKMRYPEIDQELIRTHRKPTKHAGGTSLYHFMCHVDDALDLVKASVDMLNTHTRTKEQIEADRTAIFGKIDAKADKPLPAFGDEKLYDLTSDTG